MGGETRARPACQACTYAEFNLKAVTINQSLNNKDSACSPPLSCCSVPLLRLYFVELLRVVRVHCAAAELALLEVIWQAMGR